MKKRSYKLEAMKTGDKWDPEKVAEELRNNFEMGPVMAGILVKELFNRVTEEAGKERFKTELNKLLKEYGYFDEFDPSTLEPADLNENAKTVLQKRYLTRNEDGVVVETPDEMFWRVARNIAQADRLYDKDANLEETAERFYRLMRSLHFLPNSPTLMNAGKELQQLSACFVLPVEDSMEGIFDAVKYTAIIHKTGGGTGFSFSRLRPKNDVVKSTKGVSSGPIPFMLVFDAATEAIKQGGTRRGANMGILRVDHPDILDFIDVKLDLTKLTNFNISVAVTDKFMEAVKKGEDYELINPRNGKVVDKLNAREVFRRIVHNAWQSAEPGIIFIDKINEKNPTPHLGEIESTNPCGEQPLLPYESCNLGSINLSRMVEDGKINFSKLRYTVREAVHFLDNVIDMNKFPIPQIEEMTRKNRKIGLGVMGWAEMLIKLGIPYDSEEALDLAEKVMGFILDVARQKSIELARERGPFPAFEGSVYDQTGHPPVRNATVTTIAPTGTISIIGGTSSGIEPLFAISFVRNVLDGARLIEVNPIFREIATEEGWYTDELMEKISEHGTVQGIEEVPAKWRRVFVTAHDIDPEWHVKMQAAFQKYVDNAVSKTVNFRNDATVEDIERTYWLAYELGLKGITVYRDGSRQGQVITVAKKSEEKKEISKPQPEVQIGGLKPRPRPRVIYGSTQRVKTGCGNLYVTINEDEYGIFEVFATMGKAGGCAASQLESLSRMISLALRVGVDPSSIIKQISGIRCPSPAWDEGEMVLSCADAVGKALYKYVNNESGARPVIHEERKSEEIEALEKKVAKATPDEMQKVKETLADSPANSGKPADSFFIAVCPECGSTALEFEGGCVTCRNCGWSKCE